MMPGATMMLHLSVTDAHQSFAKYMGSLTAPQQQEGDAVHVTRADPPVRIVIGFSFLADSLPVRTHRLFRKESYKMKTYPLRTEKK